MDMNVSKKIFILFVCTIFIFILSGNINSDSPFEVTKTIEENRQINEDKIPLDAKYDVTNTSNSFNLISDTFSVPNPAGDWTEDDQSTGATLTENNGNLELQCDGSDPLVIDMINLEYNFELNPFINGKLEFTYEQTTSAIYQSALRAQFYYSGTWHDVWSHTGDSNGQQTAIIENIAMNYTNLKFRFRFYGYTDLDLATLYDVTLSTYEFAVTEINGDIVEVSDNQEIAVFICPNFQNWQKENVTLRFSESYASVDSGTLINSTEQYNNFTFIIGESNYSSNQEIFYKIYISSSTNGIHSSDTFSFLTNDSYSPIITNLQNNASISTYYNDVLLTCHAEDFSGGSGLKSIQLYFGFSTNPTSADTIISTINGSIPSGGGNFYFVIDSPYISARETNYYTINATDSVGNSGYEYGSFTVSDDIPPNIQFIQTNASGSGIENNKSLKITYNITEPWDGAGLNILLLNINLSYKLNSAPENASDRDGVVLFSEFPSGNDGGLINFTIDESVYGSGDTIYFYVNASDIYGNQNCSYPIVQSIPVIDTLAPNVINWSSNGDPTSYNVSKTLSFTITEPFGGSGIDNNTLILFFKVSGPWNNITKNITKFGGDISFMIYENNYSYGDIVQYQLNVSDIEGNKYSSAVGQFYVGDLFAPQISWAFYNNSNPQYNQDFNITFWMREDSAGSHFSTAELFVKNSTADWKDAFRIFKTNRTNVYDLSGLIYIEFKINASITYSRWELDWKLEVHDIANNYNNITGSIQILDDVLPNVIYMHNNGSNDEFEYYQDAEITFSISEPIQGSGFDTNGLNIDLYYKRDIFPSGTGDWDGEVNVEESSLSEFGGIYTFIIPEFVFSYGINVYFWINASDLQLNENSTFSNYITLYVVDNVKPLIELDTSFNEQEISYHMDKPIRFNPIEYTDSSQLKNATLYWKNGSIPDTIDNDGFLTQDLSGIGGSFIQWDLNRYLLEFKYGDEIFFIILVYDNAGNSNESAHNSFIITDTVNPDYSEDPDNTDEWTYRTDRQLNFTVFDPDYANSSGIGAITLYYKAGIGVSASNYDNFTVVPMGSITEALNYYLITVYLNETLYNKDPNHRIYYIIRVTDVEGNYQDSSQNSFIIHPEVYNLGSVQGPSNQQWLDDGNVEFNFDLYFTTNMWIEINSSIYFSDANTDGYNAIIELDTEGEYLIKFKFLNNQSIREFHFYLDLYPPDKIPSIKFKLFGFEVVEINWDEPNGMDEESVYKIYRSTSSNFKIGEDTYLGEIKAGEPLSYEDNSIEPGKTYFYKVVAVDRVGHVSEASDEIEVEVPANILVPIIGLVVVGAIVGIAGAGIYKRSVNKKRQKLFSQVDLKKLDEDFDFEDKVAPKEVKWTEIKTKAAPKPEAIIQESGFEFDSQAPVTPMQNYWENKMGRLLSQAAQFELENEYGDALKAYALLIRMAERKNQQNLRSKLRAKVEKIYQNISS